MILASRASRRDDAVKGLETCMANMDLLRAGCVRFGYGCWIRMLTLQLPGLFFGDAVLCRGKVEVALGAVKC